MEILVHVNLVCVMLLALVSNKTIQMAFPVTMDVPQIFVGEGCVLKENNWQLGPPVHQRPARLAIVRRLESVRKRQMRKVLYVERRANALDVIAMVRESVLELKKNLELLVE